MKTISKDFNPSFTSHAYLLRHALLKGVTKYAPQMKGGQLLDVGCGSKPYKSLFNVTRYVGIDIENPAHPHANEQVDLFYDGLRLPSVDGYFDHVLMTEVFEHVFNPTELLKEINRALKPGGLFLLTVPFCISEHEAPVDFGRYTCFGLSHILRENGFEVVALEKIGDSFQAISCLIQAYIAIHITPQLKKIPIVGWAFDKACGLIFNLSALMLGKILPRGNELYMNNIVLCKKNITDGK